MKSQTYPLTIREVRQETPTTRSYVLEVPSEHSAAFEFEAGQFVALEVPFEGMSLRRCYSISSAPADHSEAGPFTITVKSIPDGRVSGWLARNISAGESLNVRPPEGRFVLNPHAGDAPLTFFGAGSGLTPLFSLLQHALATTSRHIKLLVAQQNPDEALFGRQLRELAKAHGSRFELVEHFDSTSGQLELEALGLFFRGREHGEFYICGPMGFMDLVEQALNEESVAADRRHFERFQSPQDPDRQPQVEQVGVDHGPKEVKLQLEGKVHLLPYAPGQTLLAAARQAGLSPPSSCEDGFCGACMAKLECGEVHMASQTALGPQEVEKGMVLTCQAVAIGSEVPRVNYDRASFKLPNLQGRGMSGKTHPVLIALTFAAIVAMVAALRMTA